MGEIYFIDKQHKLNFKKTLLRWPKANKDAEYRSACYILAVPIIFEKVEDFYSNFEYPVSWIYAWEWKYTLSKEDIGEEDSDENELGYDLTGSMVQLGKFSLNLWNGYKQFNFLDCISSLDIDHYNVVKCAMDIRKGMF